MCTTLKDEGESLLLRSYLQPEGAKPITPIAREISTGKDEDKFINSIDIVTAARATSAAPVYLPPEPWHTPAGEIVFWDGGVLNNNPIEQLWNARYDLVEAHAPPPAVSLVLSIGCGKADPSKPHFLLRILRTLTRYSESFMANTEAKHKDFERLVQRMKGRDDQNGHVEYFRFEVPTKHQHFDMADPSIIKSLETMTAAYMREPEVDRALERVAQLLASEE